MPTIKELKEHIEDLPDDEPVHYILWFKEDVMGQEVLDNENQKIQVSEEQAVDILDSLQHNHDCNYGTTWENVDASIWELRNVLS